MTSATARVRAFPRVTFPRLGTGAIVVFTGALMILSLFLRTRALGASLWMDEGLSIGIASQPFFDIPTVLRQDGAPPLYYMLLHVWMEIFGNGPGDTQGLSAAIAVLGVPTGLWAGWSLFGKRAGLIAAALMAVNPFLTTYAQEVRMYSMMVVLSLIVTTTFAHVFVRRDRRYLFLFPIALAAILYTHSWGTFVTLGTLGALVPCFLFLQSSERRGFIRDAVIGYGIAFVLYVPWIPTLLYQAAHTGAPWLNSPRFGAPVQISKSLLGGGTVTVALVLAAGAGIVALLARREERDRTPIADTDRRVVIAVLTLGVATLFCAWLFSQFSPAWTTRYLGVALGPIIVLAAFGLRRAGWLGVAALVVTLGVWVIPHTAGLQNKSNVTDLAAAANPLLRPGDLVVTLQPEQQPLINYNLRGGLEHATQLGPVKTEGVMDWRDSQERLEKATPQANLVPMLDRLRVGQHVLLVPAVTTDKNDWDAPWTQLVRRRAAQWGQAMELDGRFAQTKAVPAFYRRARRIGVRGVLYTKTSMTPETARK